jgi:ABC-2 type transport system ATP-binding protein
MIEVHKLTKYYGYFPAVQDLTFSVANGEIVGLLGPNGAGKTTTIRLLTTFLPPTSGNAKICGFDIHEEAHEVRKRIGYLPETPPLYPELRVYDYIHFVSKIKGVPKHLIRAAVNDVMEKCALTDVRNRLCGQLSKGYRQRVGLAQALVHSPDVIILDEPTSGLDPSQIIEIRKLIASLRNNHTVILSTHILSEVIQVCSKVIIISNGQIAVEGSLEAITKDKTLEEQFMDAVSKDKAANQLEEFL